MKIMHVTQFLGIGGLEKIIYHIILEQMSQGHEVSLYVYDHDQEWVSFFKKSGINVITPPMKKPGYDFHLIPTMNKDLCSADVIHTHDLNPLMYLFPIFFFKKCFLINHPRLVHTTHGLGHVERFPRYRIFEKYIVPIADKIIGVSEKIGNFYKEDLKINPRKIKVIDNGIAIYKGVINPEVRRQQKIWLCNRHKMDPNRPLILSLSRILPLKDQRFLIEAIKKRPDYQLIVVGPPSDQAYYDLLKEKEDSNIVLVGSQELVSEYNLGADLYVSASTHEGIPVAVLEAMAVETPCVVSGIPGHMTLNQFGNYVAVFPLNDQNKFLELCDLLLTEKENAQSIAQKARGIVVAHYSVKKMVDLYMKEYSK